MENVKIYCLTCGEETCGGMPEELQRQTTIFDADHTECDACFYERMEKTEEDELHKGMEEDVARRIKEEGWGNPDENMRDCSSLNWNENRAKEEDS